MDAREPKDLSVRMPAEWEPHGGCWTARPSDGELWGQDLDGAQREFAEMCRAIAGETVHCLVPDRNGAERAAAEMSGADVVFHTIPFGDIWLRDTAPLFVRDARQGILAKGFRFNGWGGKYLLAGDPELAERVAEAAGRRFSRIEWILEGGALETDGNGTFLTTRQCALNPNRMPDATEASVERMLARELGARKVVWLDRGLANDHTDGHIDNLARFAGPRRVLCMEASGRSDPNREVLDEIAAELAGARDADGEALEVVRLASPGRVDSESGTPMPASYMNFYIANASVVVPLYGTRYDQAAMDVLASCFPGREVVGIEARSILTGGGSFHCITREYPVEGDRQ